MKMILLLLPALLSLSGCFLMSPPAVEQKGGGLNASVFSLPTPAQLGIADLSDGDASNTGIVAVDLREENTDDHWAYWKAGTAAMNYRVSHEFQGSGEWDLRITKRLPLVGSNGGKTAEDEGSVDGRAAFAVIPDSWGAFIPRHISQIESLPFVLDTLSELEFEGLRLRKEYQNALVNTIGPGLLKNYSDKDHSVELSQRIFILRTADGASYYALRFYFYSRTANLLVFQWKRLL